MILIYEIMAIMKKGEKNMSFLKRYLNGKLGNYLKKEIFMCLSCEFQVTKNHGKQKCKWAWV